MTQVLTDKASPGWFEQALCAQTDPDAFFAEKGEGDRVRAAKRVCFRCEVRRDCLDYALANNDKFGVWGGLTERERRAVRRDRARKAVRR